MSATPIFPYRPESQDSAVKISAASLLISFVASLILIVFFLVIRLVFRSLYGSDVHSSSSWRWIYPVLFCSDKEILGAHGPDAAIYLVFSRVILTLSVLILICSFTLFIPICIDNSVRYSENIRMLPFYPLWHAAQDPAKDKEEYTRAASGLYVLFLSLLINSSLCYVYLFKVYLQYKNFRYAFMGSCSSNCTNLIRNVQTYVSQTEIESIYETLFPNQVSGVHRIFDTIELSSAISEYNKRFEEARRLEQRLQGKCMMPSGCIPFIARYRRWRFRGWHKRLIESRKRLVVLDEKICLLRNNPAYTAAVFVTFKRHLSTVMSRRLDIRMDGVLWLVSPAPDIRDIRWNSFPYTYIHRFVYRMITFGLVLACCLLWSFVVAFAQGLNNVERLLVLPVFSWLRFLYKKYPSQLKTIFQLIPSLFLFSLLSILRSLLKTVVKFELALTHTSKQRSYTSKLYYILIVNVFLGSVAAGSIISITGVQSMAESPIDTIKRLGYHIPAQAGFFINYLAVNSVLWNISIVIQPIRLLKWIYYNHINTTVTRRRAKWLRSLPRFHFYIEYSEQLLYFSIMITFSSLAPIITPFGVLYFGSKWIASRYFILFLHCKRYEGFASAWPGVFNHACISILVYQMIIAGYFMVFSELTMVIMAFCLVSFTLFYRWLVNRVFSNLISNNYVDFCGGKFVEPPQVDCGDGDDGPYEYKLPAYEPLNSHQRLSWSGGGDTECVGPAFAALRHPV